MDVTWYTTRIPLLTLYSRRRGYITASSHPSLATYAIVSQVERWEWSWHFGKPWTHEQQSSCWRMPRCWIHSHRWIRSIHATLALSSWTAQLQTRQWWLVWFQSMALLQTAFDFISTVSKQLCMLREWTSTKLMKNIAVLSNVVSKVRSSMMPANYRFNSEIHISQQLIVPPWSSLLSETLSATNVVQNFIVNKKRTPRRPNANVDSPQSRRLSAGILGCFIVANSDCEIPLCKSENGVLVKQYLFIGEMGNMYFLCIFWSLAMYQYFSVQSTF